MRRVGLLGGLHWARVLMSSVDFAAIEPLVGAEDGSVPVFPNTQLHVDAAPDAALAP